MISNHYSETSLGVVDTLWELAIQRANSHNHKIFSYLLEYENNKEQLGKTPTRPEDEIINELVEILLCVNLNSWDFQDCDTKCADIEFKIFKLDEISVNYVRLFNNLMMVLTRLKRRSPKLLVYLAEHFVDIIENMHIRNDIFTGCTIHVESGAREIYLWEPFTHRSEGICYSYHYFSHFVTN